MMGSVTETIRVLNQMVANGVVSRYAIGGGIGALFYIEPFETHDLDVFVDLPSKTGVVTLDPITAHLRGLGYRVDAGLHLIEGVPVQFLPVTPGLVEEAVAEAIEIRVGNHAARVMRAEHLLAIMLQVGRPAKDVPRAALLLEQAPLDRGLLQRIVQRYGLESKLAKIAGGA
jgi:hypothetical protein